MASTYTASARFNLQAPGDSPNAWGVVLNQGVFALVDTAIAGRTNFTLSGSMTLTTANGATDQARAMMLDITGGTGGTITIPSVTKSYLIRNASTGNVVVTTGSGRTATIATGNYAFVMCDATNVDRGTDQTDVDASLTAAKAYTDTKVISGVTLPGGATARSVVYTDPVSGNAIWHNLTPADIVGLASPVGAAIIFGGG